MLGRPILNFIITINKMAKEFNPKVSIIIPVYMGSNYLAEAIDSALNQTYKNIEIIVVNDGSNDDGATEKIAKRYGKKIRYFYKENGGTSTALNLAIRNMEGSYFSWLSHDDQYYPDKIKRQIQELEKLKNKNTIMMSDLDGINERYEKIYETNYIEHIKKHPLREKSYLHPIIYNQTHGCTLLIPKACFDKVGLFDEEEKVAQDFEFFYRAFSKFPHKLIPEVLVTARDSSNRQGRRSKSQGNREYSNLYIKIIKSLSESDINLLAPTKIDFYTEMLEFFDAAGYTYASEFLRSKVGTKNLQVSSYDLVGNKFNGHDLHFYLREKGIDSRQLVLYKQSDDSNTYDFDFFVKDATKNFIMLKEFYDTDILHLHLIHNIFDLNYLPLISRLKPTIITLHDPFFLAGHCVHHFDCNKWQSHCKDCPYLDSEFALDRDYSSLNFELKKRAIQDSQITAIVASKWMENKIRKSPIWSKKEIHYLPFGVNHDLFKPGKKSTVRKGLNIPQKDLVLMVRVNKGEFKGLDIIKKSLSQIHSNRKITIITVDQVGLLAEYQDRYNVIDYGWVLDDNLLVSLYQACDLFLMPSRQETFGMMAIEAMSCGKMVLAVEGEGTALPEVIDSPNCGIAVEEENYASELQRLIDNLTEITIREKKCLKLAREKYSKKTYVEGMIRIYREKIKRHKIDEHAKLILNQLRKYMPMEVEEDSTKTTANIKMKVVNYVIPEGSIFRRLYRGLLPSNLRHMLKGKIFQILELIYKIFLKKIIIKLLNKRRYLILKKTRMKRDKNLSSIANV